ncbi:MAG: Mu transposase C-terminal domain-containing protein [Alphaproteobacteria bacterium]|nr:Mu transposase C-terminal domain-containing protein [Alphaproteobacteria bacterium]
MADALRHAVTSATCPAILYYDNGSGANNKTWDDAVTGLCARLAITKVNSVPWSSQSRGVVERFHSSVLHKLARNSLAYVGPRMDKEARQKAFKISRKDIKETGSSPLLIPWSDFIQELNTAQAEYNARPHSSLAKTIDPVTGKRRHMSPGEVWDQAIQGGWQADPIPVEEARHLFRPAVRRKVARGLVSWIGNAYFAPELEALHGEFVMVSYDIHDAASVAVSFLDGRFVCEAKWNAHKTSYFPVSMVEKAQQTRLAGRLNRLDQHRDTVLAEVRPGIIEHQPAPNDVTPDMQAIADAEIARMEALALPPPVAINANGRPKFGDDLSWAAWLADHPDEVDEEDRTMVRRKARTNEFRLLCEMHGINLAGLTRAVA